MDGATIIDFRLRQLCFGARIRLPDPETIPNKATPDECTIVRPFKDDDGKVVKLSDTGGLSRSLRPFFGLIN